MKSRTSASHRDAVPRADRGAGEAGPEQVDEAQVWRPKTRGTPAPTVPASRGPRVGGTAITVRGRRRGILAAAAVVLVAAAVYGVSTLGPVRTVLRQSFTPLSSPATQFYLNGDPWVSGEYLNVPLGAILQNGPGSAKYQIQVWTVDASGKTDASTTVTLAVQGGKGAANFMLPIPQGAQLVWAQIEGTSLSVHYRFAGSALPSASSSR